MSYICPLRPKKNRRFLFIPYWTFLPHEWKILEIGVHMPYTSDRFKISRQCIHCGKWEMQHFIEHEELINLGYSQEEITKFLTNQI